MEPKAENPTFLTIPQRSSKPRSAGVTHVLDSGMPFQRAAAVIEATAPLIDIWKFGWGTAYIDRELNDKLALLARSSVAACTGGTLLEIAWMQGKATEFFTWIVDIGMDCVEVSNGATALPVSAKRELIDQALDCGLVVLTEVGSKNPDDHATPEQWVEEVLGDLAAGATWVVAEGRESGTVGLYTPSGEMRDDIVGAIESAVDGQKVIYEAPRRSQQAWLIRHVGPNVNLGNIAPSDIMSLETLRLGLRTDTIGCGIGEGAGLRDNGYGVGAETAASR